MDISDQDQKASLFTPKSVGIMAGIILLFVLTLHLMGRIPMCECGFGVWSGAWDTSTSQNVADPYSASHILHGIIFFWLLLPLRRRLSTQTRFIIAILIEVAWEIFENTPFVINRYRAATASLDYYGDSILNSGFDLLFMILGYVLASRFSWKISLILFVLIELIMLAFVRDNLTLNVLMLIAPIDAIREWQLAR